MTHSSLSKFYLLILSPEGLRIQHMAMLVTCSGVLSPEGLRIQRMAMLVTCFGVLSPEGLSIQSMAMLLTCSEVLVSQISSLHSKKKYLEEKKLDDLSEGIRGWGLAQLVMSLLYKKGNLGLISGTHG